MATPLQVMDAIETLLATIDGLRTSEVTPGQINPPEAIVGVPNISYHVAHSGGGQYDFQVHLRTSAAIDRPGQRLMAELVAKSGPRSIPARLESDRQLGGVVDDLRVTRFQQLTIREVGLLGYFGGVLTVEVLADLE